MNPSQVWNGTSVGIVFTILLGIAVPLYLREIGAKPFREPIGLILRILAILSVAFLLSGFLATFIAIPTLASVLVTVALLGIGGISYQAGLRRGTKLARPATFGEAALNFAKSLVAGEKDTALLDFRAALTRSLHLIGEPSTRRELGTLALGAARRTQRTLDEASILIDDLGWTAIELGDLAQADRYLAEAQEVISEYQSHHARALPTEATLLRIKLLRHRSVVLAVNDFESALRELNNARSEINHLPDPIRTLEDAGLDVGEGYVWLLHVEHDYGEQGLVPKNSGEYDELALTRELVSAACLTYERLGDVERAAKSAAIEARIARHLGDERAVEAARGKLNQYRALASRNVTSWLGKQ